MKIIDLSQKIYDKMPYHPYDDEPSVVHNKEIKKDQYNNTVMSVGMHIGTHVDAPIHLIDVGKGIEQYDLSKFIGKGCAIDVSGESEIQLKDKYKDRIKDSEMVLLYTGYGKYFTDAKYYADDAPVLSVEFAEFLSKSEIKMVGMDLPSPDRYPFDIHKILFNNDVLIIENMSNLDKLLSEKEFTVYAIPLNIQAEASIVRAIAVID